MYLHAERRFSDRSDHCLQKQEQDNADLEQRHRKLSFNPKAVREDRRPEEFLRLNVAGQSFKVSIAKLYLLPNSFLCEFSQRRHNERIALCHTYLRNTQEYYFERSPVLFESVLSAYRDGFVHVNDRMCVHAVLDELQYWSIDPLYPDIASVRLCCASAWAQSVVAERLAPPSPQTSTEALHELSTEVRNDFQGQCLRCVREPLWEILEIPTSSRVATIFMGISVFFVCVTMVVLVLSSMKEFQVIHFDYSTNRTSKQNSVGLDITDGISVAWFTIEYLLRLFAAPQPCHYPRAYLSIIDLLAIIPYYIEVALLQSGMAIGEVHSLRRSVVLLRILRFLRLLRVLRILKVARYFTGFQIIGQALMKSFNTLSLLVMFTVTTSLIFSTAMYFLEIDNADTHFYSIPQACWWSIITMTTVGYGDAYPITVQGKVLASMVSISGILLLAFPVSVINENFKQAYAEVHARNDTNKPQRNLHRLSASPPPSSVTEQRLAAFAIDVLPQLMLNNEAMQQHDESTNETNR